MTTPFFLIDFENVQPKALDRLKPGTSRIKVFLGQHQSKLVLELVQALQPFGKDAEYIQIQGSGSDAVDFHIAFYIGKLAFANPGATFNIISKDKGFDPLVRHLNMLGIGCRRLSEIPNLPLSTVSKNASAEKHVSDLKPPTATTTRARAKQVVDRLQKSTKPATLSTLRSSIKASFTPALDAKSVDAVMQSLQDSGKVVVTGTKVTYSLG